MAKAGTGKGNAFAAPGASYPHLEIVRQVAQQQQAQAQSWLDPATLEREATIKKLAAPINVKATRDRVTKEIGLGVPKKKGQLKDGRHAPTRARLRLPRRCAKPAAALTALPPFASKTHAAPVRIAFVRAASDRVRIDGACTVCSPSALLRVSPRHASLIFFKHLSRAHTR